MAFKTPHCSRCGHDHFNFVKCEERGPWEQEMAQARARRHPEYARPRSVPDGFREWKDQLSTVRHVGNNNWLRVRDP